MMSDNDKITEKLTNEKQVTIPLFVLQNLLCFMPSVIRESSREYIDQYLTAEETKMMDYWRDEVISLMDKPKKDKAYMTDVLITNYLLSVYSSRCKIPNEWSNILKEKIQRAVIDLGNTFGAMELIYLRTLQNGEALLKPTQSKVNGEDDD